LEICANTKHDAKTYARAHIAGIWAAALNPFNDDLSLNEAGLRANIWHWIDDLRIQRLFVAGKQGEFFSMSVAERKRNIEIAVDECVGKAGVIVSVSDQNMDTGLELAHFAQDAGADYIVLHTPVLSFVQDRGEVLYRYYKTFCDLLQTANDMRMHEYTQLAFEGKFAEARKVRDSLESV
jgi:4-hydroxy-tetrahydrodipicolinate synthase